MKLKPQASQRPACSLCGCIDRTVIACETGHLCEVCSVRIRQGRDSTTAVARHMQRAMQDQSTARADSGNSVNDVAQLEYRIAGAELMQAELLAPVHGVVLGAGGELPPQHQPMLRDTMVQPNVMALDASSARVDLLAQAGVEAVALGLDLAQSIGVQNNLERMLAHQLAGVHKVAMDTLSRAALEVDPSHRVRLNNSATRLMTTFQTGMLTLRKFRMKSDQTVMVQHVTVEDGGQAVVGAVHQTGPEIKL